MLETYKAIIHGDKIEWEKDAPQILDEKNSIAVYITVIDEIDNLPDGKKMAEVLQTLALKGGISAIENPSEWQREQRRERNLAGRAKTR